MWICQDLPIRLIEKGLPDWLAIRSSEKGDGWERTIMGTYAYKPELDVCVQAKPI